MNKSIEKYANLAKGVAELKNLVKKKQPNEHQSLNDTL